MKDGPNRPRPQNPYLVSKQLFLTTTNQKAQNLNTAHIQSSCHVSSTDQFLFFIKIFYQLILLNHFKNNFILEWLQQNIIWYQVGFQTDDWPLIGSPIQSSYLIGWHHFENLSQCRLITLLVRIQNLKDQILGKKRQIRFKLDQVFIQNIKLFKL